MFLPLLLALAAGEVRVIPFSQATQFRMGRAVSNRIVHPDMGARKITLNLSVTNRDDEFAQHVHDVSDDTILVLEGAADLRQGTTRRRMAAGQAVTIPPGEIHGTITAEDRTVMISFQTPPDFALYTGARDPSRAGAKPLEGKITPGLALYLNFAARNGPFLDAGLGATRVKATHYRLAPGETFTAHSAAGAEQVLFVWKGAVEAAGESGKWPANERDTIFSTGATKLTVKNTGRTPAVVIQAQSPPTPSHAFAGRWTLVSTDPPGRTYWLECPGTESPTGWFFGVTGGRLAEIRDASIAGDQLRFRVERVFEGTPPRKVEAWVTLRRKGDGLIGQVQLGERNVRFTGSRTLLLADRDDGSWQESAPVALFTGALPVDWEHRDGGVIANKNPKARLLVSGEKFWNFRLRAEYRLPPGGNSGIGLRHHYELQLADDYGQPPDVHGNVSLYSQIAPRRNASRPPGVWQQLEVTLIGRDLTVRLNGETVIDHEVIRGLTGLAEDPDEAKPGPIALQGDHGGIEFRNVVVVPLIRR